MFLNGLTLPDIGLEDLRLLMEQGMDWAVARNIAWPEDALHCEERGRTVIEDAQRHIRGISQRAMQRGLPQLGTLGSGNHYIEVQYVDEIFDAVAAKAMGIHRLGQICVMVHCGSRGLGHEVAKTAIEAMSAVMKRDGIEVNDPMLACTRINSVEGQSYLAQMAAASNFAFVNRAAIVSHIRDAFSAVFDQSARDLDMHVVYDVAHNVAKVEEHQVLCAETGQMQTRRLLVHRKGSTRAFAPHHPELPVEYQQIGQPVLVGGSMGTCSYVLTGTHRGMAETFGSTCHGAGRAKGRNQMKKMLSSEQVLAALHAQGICVRVGNPDSIAEEAPESYKDVNEVVDVCERADISRKSFRLRPLCVIKG